MPLNGRLKWMLVLAGIATSLPGCSSGSSRAQVAPEQFKGPETPKAADAPKAANVPAAQTSAALPVQPVPPANPTITDAAARERTEPVKADPGPPVLSAWAGPRGEPELIDAKLGDVNNRAIYASGFIKPLEAALKAKAVDLIKRSPQTALDDWRKYAMEQVARALQGFIQDEVFRAEGMASLKPEQRQGLRAYMDRLRDDEIRKSRGSLVLANEEKLAREGVSLDEYMRKQEQREIIKYELSQRIYSKVQVPWRDIKLEYEKNYSKYNRKPQAVLRMILVSRQDEAGVKAVTEALAAGTPFVEVSKLPANRLALSQSGGVREVEVEGPYAKAKFYDDAGLDAAAQGLTEGKFAGPIDFNGNRAWVCLESLRQESVSLYDAQLKIEGELFEKRRDREIGRFVGKLRSRASVSDIVDMGERLMQYAEEQCFLPVLRGEIASSASPAKEPAKDPAQDN